MRRAGVIVAVLVRTAVRGLQTSPLPSALAAITIATALTLVGAFALVLGNMQGLIERFSEELHVVAYLEPDLGEPAQRALRERVRALPSVQDVVLVTREAALERFRETLGGGELLAGLEENPLPPSLEVELAPEARTEEAIAALASRMQALAGVDELAQGQEWIEGYARLASVARTVSFVLGSVLLGAALLIVANTIRLAIYAREDEIEILALVGAGRVFQRGPFILEGLAEGALGGALALVVLYATFRGLLPQLEQALSVVVGGSAPEFFGAGWAIGLIALGALLGGAGSGFALVGWRR